MMKTICRYIAVGMAAFALSVFADEADWIDIEPQIWPPVTSMVSTTLPSGSTFDSVWRLDFLVDGIKRGLMLLFR